MNAKHDEEGYIIEFTQVGGSVKVTAMDPATLTEASIVGPAKLARELLTRQAIQKLQFVLARNRPQNKGKD